MTETQERWARIDRVLTPAIYNAIMRTRGNLPAQWWADTLGISERTVRRIRKGERWLTRKPMGGDRRSERWKHGGTMDRLV